LVEEVEGGYLNKCSAYAYQDMGAKACGAGFVFPFIANYAAKDYG
jgi:hypothetical protein